MAIIGWTRKVTHRFEEVPEFGLIAVILTSQSLEFQEEVTHFILKDAFKALVLRWRGFRHLV